MYKTVLYSAPHRDRGSLLLLPLVKCKCIFNIFCSSRLQVAGAVARSDGEGSTDTCQCWKASEARCLFSLKMSYNTHNYGHGGHSDTLQAGSAMPL